MLIALTMLDFMPINNYTFRHISFVSFPFPYSSCIYAISSNIVNKGGSLPLFSGLPLIAGIVSYRYLLYAVCCYQYLECRIKKKQLIMIRNLCRISKNRYANNSFLMKMILLTVKLILFTRVVFRFFS